ncbi:MAG: esterase-like activity of phytase family protein [Siculibacillus sp.]|nr:esterase-like activity of phytase family protein [Siculibacillus sp.]
MSSRLSGALAACLLASTALPAAADQFRRIATFHVADNLPADADPKKATSAEIIVATPDGRTLVYTDSPGERLGLVDIADPEKPAAAGVVALGGEPTSVVVAGGKALVGVVTSKSFAEPSGHVAVVDLAGRKVEATCDLGGQPDSLALSPDGKYLAVAVENERDEKVADGALPQLPAGFLSILGVTATGVDCATLRKVEMTGLAAVAGEDPEPEYVDVNGRNEAVVTLQENNHIAIVDLVSGKVVKHFSAGTVDLEGIDVKRDGIIDLSGKMTGVPREPDAVKWLDDTRFVTADEGDWKGGSRGFTIFDRDGKVVHASGTGLEMEAVRLGHYPEKRNKKGIEAEGVTVGTFGGRKLIFVGAERASLVGVYEDKGATPEFLQVLPGGVGPEGLVAIPSRNLFVTASEADGRKGGLVGSLVTIHRYGPEPVTYPTIASAKDTSGKPIPWGALSGLAAHPSEAGKLYAVTDSFYSQGRILTIDATKSPAVITAATIVTRDGQPMPLLDLEGIAVASDGGFWLASEGNPEHEKNKTLSQLIKVSAAGVVEKVIDLPEALAARSTRFGFEGVTVTGKGDDETVWIAVQREWKDDPKGFVRLLAHKPATGTWGQVRYPLEHGAGWVGLSEVTAVKGGLVVIERDNLVGPAAKVKMLTRVSLDGVTPAALDAAEVPVVKKTVLRDLIPDILAGKGHVLDKVEGFAIDAAGNAFFVTDNDGVDGSNGETRFVGLGKITE